MNGFSGYIVYADESGSPTLENPDPNYPLFVLAFVIVRKSNYINAITPAIQRLKFDFFGHDQVILHERDIRRQSSQFSKFQSDAAGRVAFLDRINSSVLNVDFMIAASVSKKLEMQDRIDAPWSPYDIGLAECMELTALHLGENAEDQRKIHVVFESRGAKEDRHLELQFRRIANGADPFVRERHLMTFFDWESIFADKRSNSTGLQLADLIARPCGLKILRPQQPNRAFDVFEKRLLGGGIKCFPQ